jgi:hypothetical protein
MKRLGRSTGKTDANGCQGRVLYAGMSTVGVPLMEVMTRRGILKDLSRFESTKFFLLLCQETCRLSVHAPLIQLESISLKLGLALF